MQTRTLSHAPLLAALVAAGSLLTAPALAAPGAERPDPVTLDATATEAVRSFLQGLEAELTAVARDGEGARQKVLERALLPSYFEPEVDAWAKSARELGKLERVRLTGVEVQAISWYGVLPISEVELFFWISKEHARLLRMQVRDGALRVFGNDSTPAWRGLPAESFGALADQVVRVARDGGCEALPVVQEADYAVVLPPKRMAAAQTRGYLERFVAELAKSCATLVGRPHHRTTWRLGDVAGVVEGKSGGKRSFRISLGHGPDQTIRLIHLTKPIAPEPRKR